MANFYFFTEPERLAAQQNNASSSYHGFNYPFGYQSWYFQSTRYSYILTSSHVASDPLNNPCNAYAITDGDIIICPVINNKSTAVDKREDVVNIVLMPDHTPSHLPKIKYIIYRNIKRSSILTLLQTTDIPSSFVLPLNASNNAINNYIYGIEGVDKTAAPPNHIQTIADQLTKDTWFDGLYNLLGFDLNLNTPYASASPVGVINSPTLGATPPSWVPSDVSSNWKPTLLETFFELPTEVTEKLLGNALQVNGGTSLGEFADDYFGIDIIFDTYQYQPTLPDVMNGLAIPNPNAPQNSSVTTVTKNFKAHYLNSLGTSPKDYQKFNDILRNDIVNHYLDPCAFFASFIESQDAHDMLHIRDTSGTKPFKKVEGMEIFKEIIRGKHHTGNDYNFYNHNKVYIDIRNQQGRSYSYFTQNTPHLKIKKDYANYAEGVDKTHADIIEIDNLSIPSSLPNEAPYEHINPINAAHFIPQLVISQAPSTYNASSPTSKQAHIYGYSKPTSNPESVPSATTSYFCDATSNSDSKQYTRLKLAFPNKNATKPYSYFVHTYSPITEQTHDTQGIIEFSNYDLSLPDGKNNNQIYAFSDTLGNWTDPIVIRIRSSDPVIFSGLTKRYHAKWNADFSPISNYVRITLIEQPTEIVEPGSLQQEYPTSLTDVDPAITYPELRSFEYLDNVFEPTTLASRWMYHKRVHQYLITQYFTLSTAPAWVLQTSTRIFGDLVYIDDVRRSGKHFMGNIGISVDMHDLAASSHSLEYGSIICFVYGPTRFFDISDHIVTRDQIMGTNGSQEFLKSLANIIGGKAKDITINLGGGTNIIKQTLLNDFDLTPANLVYVQFSNPEYSSLLQNLSNANLGSSYRYLCFSFDSRTQGDINDPYPTYSTYNLWLRGFKLDNNKDAYVEQVVGPLTKAGTGITPTPLNYYQINPMFSYNRKPAFHLVNKKLGKNRSYEVKEFAAGTQTIQALSSTLYVVRDLHTSREEYKKFDIYLKYVIEKTWTSYDASQPNKASNKGLTAAAGGMPIDCTITTFQSSGYNMQHIFAGEGIVLSTVVYSSVRSYVRNRRYMQHHIRESQYVAPNNLHPYDNLPLYKQLVAAHEYGHMIGLQDRYSYVAEVTVNGSGSTKTYGPLGDGTSRRHLEIHQKNGVNQTTNDVGYITNYGWIHNLMASSWNRVPIRADLFLKGKGRKGYIATFWDQFPESLGMQRGDFDIEGVTITPYQWSLIKMYNIEPLPEFNKSAFFYKSTILAPNMSFVGVIANYDNDDKLLSVTNISDLDYVPDAAAVTNVTDFNNALTSGNIPAGWATYAATDGSAQVISSHASIEPLEGRLRITPEAMGYWKTGTKVVTPDHPKYLLFMRLYTGGITSAIVKEFVDDASQMVFTTSNDTITSIIEVDDVVSAKHLQDKDVLLSPDYAHEYINKDNVDSGGAKIWNAHTNSNNANNSWREITTEVGVAPVIINLNVGSPIDLVNWIEESAVFDGLIVRKVIHTIQNKPNEYTHIRKVRFKEHYNRIAIIMLHSNSSL